MKILKFVICILLINACNTPQVNEESDNSELGEIQIDISGEEKAQEIFKEGLLMMHSFEYKDAAEKFQEAQAADPNCAMAYWGEAMTHHHFLWKEQDTDDGYAALEKLGETKELRMLKVETEFEKDMFEGAEILFAQGDKKEKDDLFFDHMKSLSKKYPDNHEVQSYYALSILGAVDEGRDYKEYAKCARVAQSIIDENPNHPGALHYLIHSYDDPENAHKALSAADSYSKVAPDAGHALHMPSHIYIALGMWDDVIRCNKASWEASVNRKERKDKDNDALNYHGYKWLSYAHLQKGNYTESKQMVEAMQKYAEEKPSNRALTHLIMMKGAYFSETGKWDDALVLDTLNYEDINVQYTANLKYIQSKAAIVKEDWNAVKKNIVDLEEAIYQSSNEVYSAGVKMCSGNRYGKDLASQANIDRSKVIVLELKALVAAHEGDEAAFEKHLQEAVVLEKSTSFMYGPPEIIKPSNEMYADWLMGKNRKKEAADQYTAVLERAPKRRIATLGMESLE